MKSNIEPIERVKHSEKDKYGAILEMTLRG